MNLIRSRRRCSCRRGTRCTTTCPPGPGSCRPGRPCTTSRRPSWGSSCPRRTVSATWRPFPRRTGRPGRWSTMTFRRSAGRFPLRRACRLKRRPRSGSTRRPRSRWCRCCPCRWRTGRPRPVCSRTWRLHPGTCQPRRACRRTPRPSSGSSCLRRMRSAPCCRCRWRTGRLTRSCTTTCRCTAGRILLGRACTGLDR